MPSDARSLKGRRPSCRAANKEQVTGEKRKAERASTPSHKRRSKSCCPAHNCPSQDSLLHDLGDLNQPICEYLNRIPQPGNACDDNRRLKAMVHFLLAAVNELMEDGRTGEPCTVESVAGIKERLERYRATKAWIMQTYDKTGSVETTSRRKSVLGDSSVQDFKQWGKTIEEGLASGRISEGDLMEKKWQKSLPGVKSHGARMLAFGLAQREAKKKLQKDQEDAKKKRRAELCRRHVRMGKKRQPAEASLDLDDVLFEFQTLLLPRTLQSLCRSFAARANPEHICHDITDEVLHGTELDLWRKLPIQDVSSRIRVLVEDLYRKVTRCPKGQVLTALHKVRAEERGTAISSQQSGNGVQHSTCAEVVEDKENVGATQGECRDLLVHTLVVPYCRFEKEVVRHGIKTYLKGIWDCAWDGLGADADIDTPLGIFQNDSSITKGIKFLMRMYLAIHVLERPGCTDFSLREQRWAAELLISAVEYCLYKDTDCSENPKMKAHIYGHIEEDFKRHIDNKRDTISTTVYFNDLMKLLYGILEKGVAAAATVEGCGDPLSR